MTPTCRNLKRRPESFTFFLDVQRREKLESFRPVSTFWCVLISDHHGIVFPAECLRPRPAGTRLTATCSLSSVGRERAPAADWHPAGSCPHGELVEWNRRAIAACGTGGRRPRRGGGGAPGQQPPCASPRLTQNESGDTAKFVCARPGRQLACRCLALANPRPRQ